MVVMPYKGYTYKMYDTGATMMKSWKVRQVPPLRQRRRCLAPLEWKPLCHLLSLGAVQASTALSFVVRGTDFRD